MSDNIYFESNTPYHNGTVGKEEMQFRCEKGHRMKPRKRGNKWEVYYTIPGYPRKTFTERFNSLEEANFRCAEITYEKAKGTLAPPMPNRKRRLRKMSELMDEFVESYGKTHWGESYLTLAKHRINDYIKPQLGDYLIRDINAEILEWYYKELLNSPAVHLKGHKKTGAKVSFSVMEKCHTLISTALTLAVRWGYISHNPALYVSLPKPAVKNKRNVWTPEDASKALLSCTDPNLSLCMYLSIACSMRIGEILGLQWKFIHITKETIQDNSSYLEVKQEMKRCDKRTLEELDSRGRSDVFFVFPDGPKPGKTRLVLKKPKTETSIRRVYIPNTVASKLMEIRVQQLNLKSKLCEKYEDYDLVISQFNGKPVELRTIDKMFAQLIETQGLPKVVFHSLRHLSTSLKLQYTGGDIKAVQGDTGHSQANMVTEVYSHTFDENRKRIASKMEQSFFSPISDVEDREGKDDAADNKIKQLVEILGVSKETAQMLLISSTG